VVAVIEWLQVNRKELKPAPVDLEELAIGFDPATKKFLINLKFSYVLILCQKLS
jgi:hypothetical protein